MTARRASSPTSAAIGSRIGTRTDPTACATGAPASSYRCTVDSLEPPCRVDGGALRDGPPRAPNDVGLYVHKPDVEWWPQFQGTDYDAYRGRLPGSLPTTYRERHTEVSFERLDWMEVRTSEVRRRV